MADHTPSGPLEMGANMDYAEHERTYTGFLALAKYGSLFCVALLIFMAFFFFASGGGFIGFIASGILFLIVFGLGAYALR